MRDYSQAKIYTIRNNKKIVLVYMLVQLLNHCHNDWQNINMIANDIQTFIFIKLLAINGIIGN